MNCTDLLKALFACLSACFIPIVLVIPAHGQTEADLPMHEGQAGAPIVKWLRISGNRAFSSGELKALMVTRASPWYDFIPRIASQRYYAGGFHGDLERLRAHYRNQGYLDASVESSIEYVDTVTVQVGLKINIREGSLTRIDRVMVMGVMGGEDAENAFDLLVDNPFSPNLIKKGISRVLSGLRNKGYAFARSELDTTFLPDTTGRTGAQRAALVLKLAPGSVCTVDSVRISGNKAVSEKTILSGLTFRQGDQFSEDALRNSQFSLYRARVFQSVSIKESMVSANQVDITVRVDERPFRVVRLDAGYNTDENLWASGALTHRNLGGRASQLQLSGRISKKNWETVLGLRHPYFISSRNYLNINGFVRHEQQAAFTKDELGGTLSLERNISNSRIHILRPYGDFRSTLAQERNATTDLIPQISFGVVDFSADSAFVESKVGLIIDRRDDIFDPQSGMFAQFSVRERGRFLKADSEFLQATADGRWFRPIPWRSVLALRVQGGAIFELGKAGGVPNVERFFAGGINSVRGWGFNALGPKDHRGEPTGGLSHAEMSLEIRTRIFRYWGTVIFLDAGTVEATLGAFNPASLKYAVGAGLRYFSLIGPIRFDVGYRLSDDKTAGDRVQYHISLGQAF